MEPKFKKGDKVWYMEYPTIRDYTAAKVRGVITRRKFFGTKITYMIETKHCANMRFEVDEQVLHPRDVKIDDF